MFTRIREAKRILFAPEYPPGRTIIRMQDGINFYANVGVKEFVYAWKDTLNWGNGLIEIISDEGKVRTINARQILYVEEWELSE